ncbi:HAMP domain-containing histidine kinase [Neobacillus mesonae]|nr:HAMP domain-containing histidine kinase [Neobacillus mesonae]
MRLWKTRNKRPLQTSLAFDFFRFLLIVVFVAFCAYLFIQLDVSKQLKNYKLADPDLEVEASVYLPNVETGPETEKLLFSGGWLELLDESKHIIKVIGTKRDEAETYTEEQLYGLLENSVDQEYYYSLTRYTGMQDADWLLLKVPRDRINITVNSFPFMSQLSEPLALYIMMGVIFLLLVIVGYSYTVARRIQKPLKTISEGLNEMIQGNYSTRIEIDAEEEFKQMGEKFNYMADMIEKTTEAKRMAEKSKQQMMMDLSHDLKTPITSIQGYAQALYEGRVDDPERQRKYLTYIYNKSAQVTKLIVNMVKLLKTDSPDFHLTTDRYEVGDFLRELIAENYGEIEKKSFSLDFRAPDHAVYAQFDSELFSSVVHNLISNALIHNQPGTNLRIEIIPKPTSVAIEIADNGVGIPPELQTTIFDPFVRGDKARTASGGTGLGLAIALKNTERMGGSLKLSRNNEEMTVFTIEIPL